MDSVRRALILALLPIAAHAAISRVGHAFTGSTVGSGSSITRTYTPTTANTVFVAVTTWTSGSQPTAPTISDGGTNTYTSLGDQFDGARSTTHLWVNRNVTGGSFTYTYSETGTSWMNIFVVEYSGLSATTDGFTKGAITPSSFVYTSGAITTTNAVDLLVCVWSSTNSSLTLAPTAGGSYSFIDKTDPNVSTYGALLEQIVSSTGTYAATVTLTGATEAGSMQNAATKGAGGGNTNAKVSVTIQ